MTTLRLSPDAITLSLLCDHPKTTAVEISTACRMTPGDVRRRLVTLEGARFVSGRYDTSTTPRRVYFITAEGAREVES